MLLVKLFPESRFGSDHARPFKPGQSGDPRGRSRGIPERYPGGYVKAALERVMVKNPKLLEELIERALRGHADVGRGGSGCGLVRCP